MKEELDALRETLRRREADAAQLARRAMLPPRLARWPRRTRRSPRTRTLCDEVKELRASQSSMAHEVARR